MMPSTKEAASFVLPSVVDVGAIIGVKRKAVLTVFVNDVVPEEVQLPLHAPLLGSASMRDATHLLPRFVNTEQPSSQPTSPPKKVNNLQAFNNKRSKRTANKKSTVELTDNEKTLAFARKRRQVFGRMKPLRSIPSPCLKPNSERKSRSCSSIFGRKREENVLDVVKDDENVLDVVKEDEKTEGVEKFRASRRAKKEKLILDEKVMVFIQKEWMSAQILHVPEKGFVYEVVFDEDDTTQEVLRSEILTMESYAQKDLKETSKNSGGIGIKNYAVVKNRSGVYPIGDHGNLHVKLSTTCSEMDMKTVVDSVNYLNTTCLHGNEDKNRK